MKNLSSLALEQKEDIRHGGSLFPMQKYMTTLSEAYPLVTTHWHEEAELTLILENACCYHINLQEYAVEKGDLLFVPPMFLHSVTSVSNTSMYSETYVFHMNFLGGNATDICTLHYLLPIMNQEILLPCVIKKEHPAYRTLLELFYQISAYYIKTPDGYELALKALLLQVLFLLLQYSQTPKKATPVSHSDQSDKLKSVLDYIDTNYENTILIEDLAKLCYFSEYHFMRFFKKHVGMTCLQYINNLRLEKAVELFEQGEISTLEVSLSVGFHNLSYFHRAFKKNIM